MCEKNSYKTKLSGVAISATETKLIFLWLGFYVQNKGDFPGSNIIFFLFATL